MLGAPVEELSIHIKIPIAGYYLRSCNHCPTLIMIGGGNAYREDLFHALRLSRLDADYNVLWLIFLVRSNPGRGLTFDVMLYSNFTVHRQFRGKSSAESSSHLWS